MYESFHQRPVDGLAQLGEPVAYKTERTIDTHHGAILCANGRELGLVA